jgi:hypothetical protein
MNRKECLETALEIVMKDRQNDYGTPESNFATIAAYWSNYLQSRGFGDVVVAGHDVAAMMALLKIARIASSPAKEDNWVDLAGYAANGIEVAPQTEYQATYTPDILLHDAAVHVCTPCEDTEDDVD